MADVQLNPTGGLCEYCEDDCGDEGRGVGICLCNDTGIEDPPTATRTNADGSTELLEIDNPLRRSTTGCLWIKPTLGTRFKKDIGAQIAQPASLNVGGVALVGTAQTIEITNDTPETVCYDVCVDICNAFIDCPSAGAAGSTVTVPAQSVEVTGSSIQASGEAETLTIPARSIDVPEQTVEVELAKASTVYRLTFNGKTCEVFSADADYVPFSGRVCLGEIEVDAGATFTSDLIVDLLGKGNAANPFTASSGELCVIATEVACAVKEC